MRQQTSQLFLAGMVEHQSKLQAVVERRLESGWIVMHMVVLGGGSLFVIFEKTDGAPPVMVGSKAALGVYRNGDPKEGVFDDE